MAKRTYSSGPQRDLGEAPSFELDGVTFTCVAKLSPLDLAEFARFAGAGVDSASPDGVAAIGELLTAVLGDATYGQLRRHVRTHNTPDETIVDIIGDLIEDFTQRPTSRPSDSSDGPTAAPATARVVSFSRGTVSEVEAPPTATPEPAQRGVSYG